MRLWVGEEKEEEEACIEYFLWGSARMGERDSCLGLSTSGGCWVVDGSTCYGVCYSAKKKESQAAGLLLYMRTSFLVFNIQLVEIIE